jgi:hypothetical protein
MWAWTPVHRLISAIHSRSCIQPRAPCAALDPCCGLGPLLPALAAHSQLDDVTGFPCCQPAPLPYYRETHPQVALDIVMSRAAYPVQFSILWLRGR